MATKKIYVSLSTTGAKATDEVWLSCGSGASIYAQTYSGLTYGWTANAGGVSVVDTSAVASGIYPATTIVAAGTSQKIRVDKAAGTYTLKAVGMVPSGGFASKRLRVLDSDNSTVLWTQPAADIAGAAADYQINTDGSLVSYGAADAGVSITTTGAQFYIEIVSSGGFNARYSRFEISDPAAVFTSLSISNPNTTYTIGVLLSPIVVTALDQFGATFTGTVPDCTVSSLTLPVTVTGTLTVSFVLGIATFSNLTPIIFADVRTLLAGRNTANWCRIRVKNAAGTYQDVRSIGGADYELGAVVTRDQEAPASTATITLRAGKGSASIMPLVTAATANASGRLIDVGRAVQVWSHVTAIGVTPIDADYSLVFEGTVDTVAVQGVESITLTCRDNMVAVLDGVFGAQQTYGSGGGTAVQTVIQSMLDYVLGTSVLTLSVPTSPAWGITDTPAPYTVLIGTTLYAAIRQLLDQIGWRLVFNYPANVATLQLLGPNRSPSSADFTIAASEVRSVEELTLSRESIRNSVTVQYRNSSGVLQTPVVSTNGASQAAYGVRPMVIKESASSQIKDSTAATRMADAILSDLALPLITKLFTHQHAFWPILPGHVLDLLPNTVQYDGTQRLAVSRTVLTLANGGGSAAISLRGSPASRARGWFDLSGPTPVDTDTVTPTMVATPVSIPTNGGSTALHTEWVVTGLNPKVGGALPVLRVYFDAAYLTVQYWSGSAWTGLADGAAITSGWNVRALRPTFGREVQRITFTATITGGGVDRIVQTVPNQDPVAPAVIATLTASTATSKTYRITTTVGGLQVRYTGGTATKTAGLASGTYGTEPQDYTFARPAAFTGDADAKFECVTSAGSGAIKDSDSVTIPEVGRDTVPILTRARIIAETATTATVRISSSRLYADDAGTVTLTSKGTAIVDLVGGATNIAEGDSQTQTISTADGYVGSAGYYRDYLIYKAAIGTTTAARLTWRVDSTTGISTPDSDSVDVQPQIARTPGRISVVQVIPSSGASVEVRWRSYNADASQATATGDAALNYYTAVSAGGSETGPTAATVTYDSGNTWYTATFTRTDGAMHRIQIVLDPVTANGTARTEQWVTAPVYYAIPIGSSAPNFGTCTVFVPTTANPVELRFTVNNAPSGYTVDSMLVYKANPTGNPVVGVTLSLTNITTGETVTTGRTTSSAPYLTQYRVVGTIYMKDSTGVVIATRAVPETLYYGL